jgi:hypothetical protein
MKTIGATRLPGADEDAQAVIRQARRRQRRRQLVTGAVALLTLGGALGGYAAASGTGHPGAARAVGDSDHRSPPGPGALGTGPGAQGAGATVLMWPGIGYSAYLGNLGTGRLVQRDIPGIIGGDYSPFLIAVGHQLVYAGQDGTTAIAADLAGKPRVLGTTQFFAPSAEPGHVWLIYDQKTANVVRSVPVTGGPPGPRVTLPRRTFLAQGTDRGLLLEGPPDGTLLMWTPHHAPRPLPHSANWNDMFAADARIVAYGTGCKWLMYNSGTPYHERIGYDACRVLRVFDVVTGNLDSIRAPQGTAGWVQSGIHGIGMDNAISPRGTMIAAEAVTSPRRGQARLFVLALGPRHPKPTVVPSSAAFMAAMTTWSPDGSWLFYQGPGGHLWAYQDATGRTRPSAIPSRPLAMPCCQYNAMAAIPSPP